MFNHNFLIKTLPPETPCEPVSRESDSFKGTLGVGRVDCGIRQGKVTSAASLGLILFPLYGSVFLTQGTGIWKCLSEHYRVYVYTWRQINRR